MKRRKRNPWLTVAINLALIAAGLTALSFLPPDNSLAEVRRIGALKLCVPSEYPVLVEKDLQKPGFDVELARKIAEELGVRLVENEMMSMGKDFNPRNWQLTRGQCNVIAGGLADTETTRSFLQTIPTGIETGWVAVSKEPATPQEGQVWAVWPGSSGLDRIALSSWLRERGIRPVLLQSPDQIVDLIESGQIYGAIVERLIAAPLVSGQAYAMTWLAPETFTPVQLSQGLWKGDQTLYRAARQAMEKIRASDWYGEAKVRYGLDAPIAVIQ